PYTNVAGRFAGKSCGRSMQPYGSGALSFDAMHTGRLSTLLVYDWSRAAVVRTPITRSCVRNDRVVFPFEQSRARVFDLDDAGIPPWRRGRRFVRPDAIVLSTLSRGCAPAPLAACHWIPACRERFSVFLFPPTGYRNIPGC